MVSYYTWAQTFNPFGLSDKKAAPKERMLKELDDALAGDRQAIGRWADEAIARSGLLGVLSEGMRAAERFPATQNLVTFANQGTARNPYANPIVDLAGPTASLLINDVGALTGSSSAEVKANKVQRMIPYQNVFYLRSLFDTIYDYSAKLAGINMR